MARVIHVKKARKDQGDCLVCHQPIRAGESYKWFANRIGRSSITKRFCNNCRIRPSHQTTSHHLSSLYSAIEGAEDTLAGMNWDNATLDDVGAVLTDCADSVREVAEGYRESAQNIEDGFGHRTYQADELDEKADELDGFADELEGAASDVEGLPDWHDDDDDFKASFDGELDDDDNPEDEDEWADHVEAERASRFADAVGRASDALSESPM